jgi:Icc protein
MRELGSPSSQAPSYALSKSSVAKTLTWMHLGDLHITAENQANYRHLEEIIVEANECLADAIDFAVIPGDVAENGTAAQYRLARQALDRLRVPLHFVPGDHDMQQGSLAAFHAVLGAEKLPKALSTAGYQCLFLDVVSPGTGGPDFRIGSEQLAWLESQLRQGRDNSQPAVVFMHTYPRDLKDAPDKVCRLFASHRVLVVDMGHTHYNELANDGRTIFAATRSIGQVEEGPPGFSLTAIDRGAVSWRFKPLASSWPFVLITSPSDQRLDTKLSSSGVKANRPFEVRARGWGGRKIDEVACRIDAGVWREMSLSTSNRTWRLNRDAPAQAFRLDVRAIDSTGISDTDTVDVDNTRSAQGARRADGSDVDAIGAWLSKGILGTQLGPNRNGRRW